MRLVKAWLKTMVTVGVLALSVSAQSSLVDSDSFVTTADGVSIHVHRKVNGGGGRVPLLLIHGTFADARVWDFPGRSVMS